MEYKEAFEFIYKKSIELGLFDLAKHIENVGPLKIKLSKNGFR
tara:strand:+ start:78 stop:206 length:129 start_codon:yes stop_codon:yes gene_type:complete